MPTFNIHFGHDHGFSEREIEAASLREALETAKAIEVVDADFVGHYNCSLDAQYIRVLDADDNELCWDHPDVIRDYAAQELLEAAEELLASLNAPGIQHRRGDCALAFDGLRRAVAKARGIREVSVSQTSP